MKLFKRLWTWFMSLFKKPEAPQLATDQQEALFKLIGVLTLQEFQRSRSLRRKVKGTMFEAKLTKILNDNANK